MAAGGAVTTARAEDSADLFSTMAGTTADTGGVDEAAAEALLSTTLASGGMFTPAAGWA